MMSIRTAIYGAPLAQLGLSSEGAQQVSPLFPGAMDLSKASPGSLDRVLMTAPPGTLERRRALAEALLALAPGGELLVAAPNERGGRRLRKELTAFGCAVEETSKHHHRLCRTLRPELLRGIEAALRDGGPCQVEATGLWSQPGVFSWDRIDPGSALLASRLPLLRGQGADFGCGIGYLALHVLRSPAVTRLDLLDVDRRAIEAARRNVHDPRAHLHWTDVTVENSLKNLDFVVMNPPFHHAGDEDKALGQAFVRRAGQALRSGGSCWLVANRHLPYEVALQAAFKTVRLEHQAGGFKIYEARA